MPAWVNLDSELPLKLRKDVANIALEVWKAAGSNHVTSLDGWWYTSHCLYLPFPDGSPAVIVINCMEGEADQPKQQCRYMVDVVRQRVKNMEDNSYKSILPASDEAVIRIVDWVQGIHERDPAAARAQQQRRLEAAERYRQQELQRRREHDDAFEVYRKRIADFQTSQPTPSKRARVDFRQEVPGGPNTKVASSCPECSKVLVHCNKCRRLSCPKKGCPGQGSDLFLACTADGHQNEAYCSQCREEAAGTLNPLVAACPICEEVFCGERLQICEGKGAGGRHAHKPRVLCCERCRASEDKLREPSVFSCVGERCRQERFGNILRSVCSECAGRLGRICEEPPWEWWSDDRCAEAEKDSCPSCKAALCPQIRNQACDECQRTASCTRCLRAPEKQPMDEVNVLMINKVKEEGLSEQVGQDRTSKPRVEIPIIKHRLFKCDESMGCCSGTFSLCDQHDESAGFCLCVSCNARVCYWCRRECFDCHAGYCDKCYASGEREECDGCGEILDVNEDIPRDEVVLYTYYPTEVPMGNLL